jgi:abequosyltransferase
MESNMTGNRPMVSVCIPSYNRAVHLAPLLDSIFGQRFANFEVVICEDLSREREEIASIVQRYMATHPGKIRFFENERNLGYDANIRKLVEKATGKYCFFMGNDDIMCPGALEVVADILERNADVGFILRSYAWFDNTPEQIGDEIRYFNEERVFAPGKEAISICFRRSGVISGYIVDRDAAFAAATSKFDGSLYYQMHLTASALVHKCAVFTPQVLVLCRNSEPPEFGNSANEKGKYTPGKYTPDARLHMIAGVLAIIQNLREVAGIDLVDDVTRDYANYFYPYIRDQLKLDIKGYLSLYRSFGRMGFARYPLFHVYFVVGYILGAERFDQCVKLIRSHMGRSPHFGMVR